MQYGGNALSVGQLERTLEIVCPRDSLTHSVARRVRKSSCPRREASVAEPGPEHSGMILARGLEHTRAGYEMLFRAFQIAAKVTICYQVSIRATQQSWAAIAPCEAERLIRDHASRSKVSGVKDAVESADHPGYELRQIVSLFGQREGALRRCRSLRRVESLRQL